MIAFLLIAVFAQRLQIFHKGSPAVAHGHNMVAREFYVRLPAAARGASVVIHPFHQLPGFPGGETHLHTPVPLFGFAILSGFFASDSYPSLFFVVVHNIAFAHIDNVCALLLIAILGHPVGDRRCVGFTPRYSHSPPPFDKVLLPGAGKYGAPKIN